MNKNKINELTESCKKELDVNKASSPRDIANIVMKACDVYRLQNNQFYCKYGKISEDEIKKIVLNAIDEKINNANTESLFNKIMFRFNILSYDQEAFDRNIKENIIPVNNGSLIITKNYEIKLDNSLSVAPYRLPVSYNPNAPKPVRFIKWLSELFMPEDIKGFQEFMGYCLVPTTKAQKMLLVMGNGREGKSIIGQILKELLGDAWVDTDLHDITEDRFTLSTLDYRLVAYQDDTDERPLKYTATFKKLVTNNGRIMVERKGIDKYESITFIKIIACTNHSLSSLTDNSDGFFRRIYPIRVKPRPKDRIDIKGYAEPILKELEGILNWCLEGLIRLQKNDYEFTQSQRSLHIINDMEEDANNIETFINERLEIGVNNKCSSKDIYIAYRRYCNDYCINGNDRQSHKNVTRYFKNNAERLNINISRNGNEGTIFKNIKIKDIDDTSILGG